MTETTYAWKASEKFTAALRAYNDLRHEFVSTVVAVFDEQHPNNRAVWRNAGFSLDVECCGFRDDGDLPPGLSRAQTRSYLIPVRSKAGDEWRAARERLNKVPSLDKVFTGHGCTPFVLDGNRICTPGFFLADNAAYVSATGDIATTGAQVGAVASEHLTPIKLSEFHAAKETLEESAR